MIKVRHKSFSGQQLSLVTLSEPYPVHVNLEQRYQKAHPFSLIEALKAGTIIVPQTGLYFISAGLKVNGSGSQITPAIYVNGSPAYYAGDSNAQGYTGESADLALYLPAGATVAQYQLAGDTPTSQQDAGNQTNHLSVVYLNSGTTSSPSFYTHQSSGQSISNSMTPLDYGTTLYNYGFAAPQLNPGSITIPKTGYYLVNAEEKSTGVGSTAITMNLTLYENGNDFYYSPNTLGGTGHYSDVSATIPIYLTAGTTISADAAFSPADTSYVDGVTPNNQLEIQYIGN